ncbi:MAG TPA: hypothetical protein VGE55_08490 [Limnobacter sp.]|uniref:hypothetical protein n=1 Tax=Limnobacter sp. TaxID=2003368 RepID=UPI002ED77A8F
MKRVSRQPWKATTTIEQVACGHWARQLKAEFNAPAQINTQRWAKTVRRDLA